MDKGISSEYGEFLKEKKLPMPSKVVSTGFDVDYWIEKAMGKMEYLEEYVNVRTDSKGEFRKEKYSSDVKITYDRNVMRMSYLKDYLERLKKIKAAPQHEGTGVLSQRNRNAYKIGRGGSYGNLTIDLPKLMGQLKLVAHKNGSKVYDKVVDFDTVDLLTKRFNSRKNDSNLSKKVFDKLNSLSEIPIHKTSKKYQRIGSGVLSSLVIQTT